MSMKENEEKLSYEEKAFITFNEMMSNNQKDMLESMNKANKGELFVLHFLTMRNEEVFPSEISIALRVSTARISALLGNLEKKGQIEREIDKTNRRNILVTVTEDGRKRVRTEMKEMQKSMSRVFTEMGEADTAEFLRLSKRFFKLLQKYMPSNQEEGGFQDG
ncbi:MAG: transcriptional regulator [Candidatus Izemoplasmatales bacterium]